MIGSRPTRPTGSDPEDIFHQWVWDQLTGPLRVQDAPGQRTSRTTRGTFVEVDKSRSSSAGAEERLFNLAANGAFVGNGVGPGTKPEDSSGVDLGAYLVGWTSVIEASIVTAIRSGKRIRTSLIFNVIMFPTSTNDPMACTIGFNLYTGTTNAYTVKFAGAVNNTNQIAGGDTRFACSFQGEITQSPSGAGVSYSQAAQTESCSIAPGAANLGVASYFLTFGQYVYGTPPLTDLCDGKITGYGEVGTNCQVGIFVQSLTIDALPAL